MINVIFEATLASDLPNGLKAGETVKMNGRTVFQFTGDKISSIVDYS